MATWIAALHARLISKTKQREQSPRLVGRLVGPIDSRNAKLRLLVVADAAGATLQINLLRPANKAVIAGDIRMIILTEDDERKALAQGRSALSLLEDAWQEASPDLVFVSRYGGSLAGALLQKSSDKGIPLVYHIDDNLFEVPLEAGLEKAKKYSAPARQQAIQELLKSADAVYLSTARLADQLREHTQLSANVFVGEIASASDPIRYGSAVKQNGLHLGYMASSSHAADLELALPGIIMGLTANTELQFTVFGSLRPPAALSKFGSRVQHIPAVGNYDDFLEQLAAMRWNWGIAPLRPGRFNEAKTDTKWVEYSAAGIPTIVSDHTIYQECIRNGAAVQVGDMDWADRLPVILADRVLAERTLEAARERLIKYHGLVRMSVQLSHVFKLAGLSSGSAEIISMRHL